MSTEHSKLRTDQKESNRFWVVLLLYLQFIRLRIFMCSRTLTGNSLAENNTNICLTPMSEYNESISRKTWSRTIEPVAKIGYMDGASDGQTAVFQESFNVGYKQGFTFGLELGFSEAISSVHQKGLPDLEDQRKINCQICTNVVKAQENIGNLYNIQQEKNTGYLLRCNKDG